MKIFVDIDETICHGEFPYNKCVPLPKRIEKINTLFDKGHHITYWTARGGRSGVDFTQITKAQLEIWGAKHDVLLMNNKPSFDLYICDKSMNSEAFFEDDHCGISRK